MLLFLGCFRPGFRAVQHLHPPHTLFFPVRDRAVTGWTVRNQGNKRSATTFGNVCLYEPTGWLEGKNNILQKLGQLIPAGLGEVRSSLSREGKRGTLSAGRASPNRAFLTAHLPAALCPPARSLRFGFAPLFPGLAHPFRGHPPQARPTG